MSNCEIRANPLILARKCRGMTQKSLAAAISKPQQYIARIEAGTQPIGGVSLRIAIQIADALGVDDLRDLLPAESADGS